MARTPRRLAGPLLVTSSSTTRYTVPALTKTIVRHIHVSNPSASPVTFTLTIGSDAAPVRLFDAFSIPAASVLDHFCYYIVDGGEIMQTNAGTTNILVFTMDGDEITLG